MQFSDRFTTEDQLGFDEYREALVEVIQEADTPITVGLFGSWGSGKTSLMRMMQKQLDQGHRNGEKTVTVWFDAWKYDKEEVLWRALLMHTLEALRPEKQSDEDKFTDKEQTIIEDLDDLQASLYRDVDREESGGIEIDWREATKGTFKLGLSMLPILPQIADAGETLKKLFDGAKGKDATEGAKKAADHLANMFKAQRTLIHRDHVQFLDQFQTNFQKVVNRCLPEKGRLVVFIDDLDRCLPEKAVEILEAVKLFLEAEQCVYVVGVDHRVIEQGIKVKYKALGLDENKDDLPVKGDEYLEKIVQIPFHLPPIVREDIEQFTAGRLSEDFGAPVAAVFAAGLEPVPRKIKRVLNIFHLLWTLAKKKRMTPDAPKEGVTPLQPGPLAKIVVIQHRSRRLFEHIQRYKRLLTELETYFADQPDEEEDVLQVISEETSSGETPPDEAGTDDAPTQTSVDRTVPAEGTLLAQYAGEQWLRDMLLTDREYPFAEIDNLMPYITFTATVAEQAPEPEDAPVDEKIWADLKSGDPTKVNQARSDMKPIDLPNYRKRLLAVLQGETGAPADERIAAGNALAVIGDPRFVDGQGRIKLEPDMISIPAGSFTMGDDQGDDNMKPQRTVTLSPYSIGKYPVTNIEYQAFVKAAKHEPPRHWEDGRSPAGQENHPVTHVSWDDANTYADWLSKKTGQEYTLPTEAQWERAARGDQDVRKQPWDGALDTEHANIEESGIGGTTPVGAYPAGKSPCEAMDMVGNVWEWCADWYDEDYYSKGDKENPMGPDAGDYRVLRGGSWADDASFSGCSSRSRALLHDFWYVSLGFRLSRTL